MVARLCDLEEWVTEPNISKHKAIACYDRVPLGPVWSD
jgi:hypothetical protein